VTEPRYVEAHNYRGGLHPSDVSPTANRTVLKWHGIIIICSDDGMRKVAVQFGVATGTVQRIAEGLAASVAA
jgi:hypothetical protein